MKEDLIRQIAIHKNNTNQLKVLVKKYVQDTSYPVDDRWEVFIASGVGDFDSSYHEPDGIDWSKCTLYDDFYLDKYQEINVENMLERAIDDEVIKQGSEEEIQFKEYFLKNFIRRFKNDW